MLGQHDKELVVLLAAAMAAASLGSGCAGARQAKRTDPLKDASPAMLVSRGRAFAKAGDSVRAEQYLIAGLERGAPRRVVWRDLITVCLRGRRYRSALGYARRYLAAHPGDWALRQVTATLYLAIGDPHRALDEIERVVGEAPRVAAAHHLLGVILRDEFGDTDGARRALSRYLELGGSGPRAAEARVWLRRRAGARNERSKRRWRRAR